VLPDLLAADLSVLFCGINPGKYSAQMGHHFARPGNRFWRTMHAAGFTPRLFAGVDDRLLVHLGYGLTNIVSRATVSAIELSRDELRAGRHVLEEKLERYKPRFLAVLGLTAFRTAFDRPDALVGRQHHRIGETTVWLLPNPSGLNAHYLPPELARRFRALRVAAIADQRRSSRFELH
jgi:TDG/mug DNA glycosylase family protein